MKKVTSKCRYCGKDMFPYMEYDKLLVSEAKFSLKCPKCGSTSPVTSFSSSFIDTECLVEDINKTLSYDFDIEEDFEEED